jgi:photosystem II stability/assembly factor-like uncharacterized protein
LLRLRGLLPVVVFIVAVNCTQVSAQQKHSPQNSGSAAQLGPAATIDPGLYSALRWRLIGPYRAGRVSAVAGIPGDPTAYYMGTPGGGVWKTTSAGTVWTPIFDQEHVASIGDVAVAPSNPSIIIVGTGEQTDGNGVYRSTDAGATWTNIGLKDSKYISTVIIDPRNPDIILVGVLGHPILGVSKPGENRGVYRTTDGGKTWAKTLYKDDMAGVSNMAADPNDPRILYAALWTPFDFRSGPPEGRSQDSWIYKSTDEGASWRPVSESGLPTEPRGRVGLAVAPGTKGQRVFAIMEPGLFRSDDGGATWRQITKDPRINGNLYICRVYVDPNNADIVYVMQTTTYRSTDGGQNFIAYKGAPGGDDYHVLWIDPQNSQRMILGVDQGATISVDGGHTWSSWYNQPTGQFYHVITDNQFPYVSYAPQQDSGTVAVPNRSDYGEISFRDWFSIGGFEFCYIAPDPTNPNIVYSGGWYGSVVRFDKTTGQIVHVFVRDANDHMSQMPPLVFSPQDPHTLYLGAQYVLKTTNAGQSWTRISPDLTTPAGTPTPADQSHSQIVVPAGAARPPVQWANGHAPLVGGEIAAELEDREAGGKDDLEFGQRPPRSALTVLTPSPVSADVMWAGTTNGVVHATRDAAQNWLDVTPPELPEHSEIIAIEASPYEVGTAYVVVEARQDPHPYFYRTRDGGRTWQKITDGLDPEWVARIVREDPVRKGLLYAGTANALYVSFDDGDHWQSLQLNFPSSDVRDLAVHGNDLVAATYGRSLWILDDLTPLRLAGPEILTVHSYLLKPEPAVRMRYDNDQETPLPPEEPTAKNPPDGAIIDYYLDSKPSNPLTLEIHDSQGKLVRGFTSLVPKPDTTPKNVPDYWFGAQPQLSTNVGMNRFVWDLRYDPPDALNFSYYGGMLDYIEYTLSDHALPADTPREQTLGPIAVPGQYQLTFIGNGSVMKQPLTITLDPRVHVSQADLEAQLVASKRIVSGLAASAKSFNSLAALRAAIADRLKTLGPMPEEKPSAGNKEAGAADNAVAQANAKEKTEEEKAKDAQAAKLAGARSQTNAPPLPSGANVAAANAARATAVNPQAKAAADALKDLDKRADAIQEGSFEAPGVGPINRDLARTSFFIQSGDAAPSETAKAALDETCSTLNKDQSALRDLSAQTVPKANALIAKADLAPLPSVPAPPGGDACQP